MTNQLFMKYLLWDRYDMQTLVDDELLKHYKII
jgi:hypothetical protein